MAMYFDEGDQPQPLSSTVPGIAPVAPPIMQNMGSYQQQGDLYRQFLHPYGAPQPEPTPFASQQAQQFQPTQANMQSVLDQRNQQSMLDQYRAQNNIPVTQYNPMRPVGLDDSGMGAGATPLTQQQFMNNVQGAGLSFGAPQQMGLGAAAQAAMANQNRNPYQQQGPMPALQSAFTQPPVASGGIGSLNQSQSPSSLSQTSNSNQGASSSEPVNLGAKMAGPNGAMTGSGNQQQSRIVGGNGVM